MSDWIIFVLIALGLGAAAVRLFAWRFRAVLRGRGPERQCTTACYNGHLGPPERCAEVEGHEGPCAP